MQKGIVPSVLMLREELTPEVKTEKKKSFFEHFDDFQQSAKLKGRKYNTLRNYISLRNHLQDFGKHSGLTLEGETYDLKVQDTFLAYLVYEVEQAPNSVFSTVKNLKVFLKFLAEERNAKLHPDVARIKASYIAVEKIFFVLAHLSCSLPTILEKLFF